MVASRVGTERGLSRAKRSAQAKLASMTSYRSAVWPLLLPVGGQVVYFCLTVWEVAAATDLCRHATACCDEQQKIPRAVSTQRLSREGATIRIYGLPSMQWQVPQTPPARFWSDLCIPGPRS